MTDTTHAPGFHDRFTGLPGLQDQIERSVRAGTDLTAVFVDGDPPAGGDWSPAYGNGDTPVPRIAAPLAAQVRGSDLIVLLGGQSLLCAMPGLTPADARRRFDHMADGLGTERIRVGIAGPQRGDGASRLVARAQAAAPVRQSANGGPTRLSLRLAADRRSARRARAALQVFEDEMAPDELAVLSLVVTELVTNSVRHGGSDRVHLELCVSEGLLHGSVVDYGTGFEPALPQEWPPDARGGLGLVIVERTARRWGTTDEGRRVWFELGLAAPAGRPEPLGRP
jgi:anti-sigma regulatory factor (Ser/Thr protein kinase)